MIPPCSHLALSSIFRCTPMPRCSAATRSSLAWHSNQRTRQRPRKRTWMSPGAVPTVTTAAESARPGLAAHSKQNLLEVETGVARAVVVTPGWSERRPGFAAVFKTVVATEGRRLGRPSTSRRFRVRSRRRRWHDCGDCGSVLPSHELRGAEGAYDEKWELPKTKIKQLDNLVVWPRLERWNRPVKHKEVAMLGRAQEVGDSAALRTAGGPLLRHQVTEEHMPGGGREAKIVLVQWVAALAATPPPEAVQSCQVWCRTACPRSSGGAGRRVRSGWRAARAFKERRDPYASLVQPPKNRFQARTCNSRF